MMTKSEAEKVLSYNVLDLYNESINEFPLKSIVIDVFNVTNEEDNFSIHLIGLVTSNNQLKTKTELLCKSFMVQDRLTYYYRYSLLDAFKVIEALRVINNYSFDSESLKRSTIYYN